jgi:hypothetical protein
MAAAPASIPIPGMCRVCGCTQFDACRNDYTGETCDWANRERTLCTFCAVLPEETRKAFHPAIAPPEPRVVLATEGECNQYLRTLREGN